MLTSVCLAPQPLLPAGSAFSPAWLCRGAASGHSCVYSVLPGFHQIPPSQELSPDQQQRTSPKRNLLCPLWAPSRCPWGSNFWQLLKGNKVLPGDCVLKSTQVIMDNPSLNCAEGLIPAARFVLPVPWLTARGGNVPLWTCPFLYHNKKTQRQGKGGVSFTCATQGFSWGDTDISPHIGTPWAEVGSSSPHAPHTPKKILLV